MKCCFNWKVIAGLGLAALVVWAAAPDVVGRALPLLVGLICPISMVVMVLGMRGANSGREAAAPVSPDERLAQLRLEQRQVQAELDALAGQLAEPEPVQARGGRMVSGPLKS